MRLFRHIWLIAGLMPGLCWARDDAATTMLTQTAAPTANLDIWMIDESCTNYHDGSTKDTTTDKEGGSNEVPFLQEQFNTVLAIAIKTVSSLNFVLGKQPDRSRDEVGYLKWIRIADSVATVLGFVPKRYEVEKATDAYWADAFELFEKMVKTLQASENDPPKGYNPLLASIPGAKPLFICGDNWDWYGKTDNIPVSQDELDQLAQVYDGDEDEDGDDFYYSIKLEDIPALKHLWEENVVGGWYKHHRWEWVEEERQKPIKCEDGIAGVTDLEDDFVTLCDSEFTDKETNRWVKPEEIKEGDSIVIPWYSTASSLLHELCHWFSGKKKDEPDPNVEDLQAVDQDGNLIYVDVNKIWQYSATPKSKDEMKKENLKKVLTYGRERVWNLARSHDGETAANSGPKKALKNADSLAMFGLMMFYDEWVWASEGRARKPGRINTAE